jgi:hypothetical protein
MSSAAAIFEITSITNNTNDYQFGVTGGSGQYGGVAVVHGALRVPKGAAGPTGAGGTNGTNGISTGIPYKFSSTQTASDPGSGYLRLNSSLGLSTSLYIDYEDSNAVDTANFTLLWDAGTSVNKGILTITKKTAPSVYGIYHVTNSVDSTGYVTVTLDNIFASGSLANNDDVILSYSHTGDAGPTGADSTVEGPAGATAYTGHPFAFGGSGAPAAGEFTTNGSPVFGSPIRIRKNNFIGNGADDYLGQFVVGDIIAVTSPGSQASLTISAITVNTDDYEFAYTGGVGGFAVSPTVHGITRIPKGATGPTGATGAAGSSAKAAIYQEQQTSGTNGGTFTSGAWRTRALNTETFDPDTIASLSGNNIVLAAAGTYLLRASAQCYNVNRHQARIYNVTDSSVIALGSSAFTGGAANHSIVSGMIVTAGAKTIRLEHRCRDTQATWGLGVAGSFGTEVYAELSITKIA